MTQEIIPSFTHSLASIYDILQDRRRRLVLHHLRAAPDGVSHFDAITEQLQEWDHSTSRPTGTGESEAQIAAMLHHVHLPLLAEHNVIEYDWRTKTVRYRPDDFLEAHLNLAERRDLEQRGRDTWQ